MTNIEIKDTLNDGTVVTTSIKSENGRFRLKVTAEDEILWWDEVYDTTEAALMRSVALILNMY